MILLKYFFIFTVTSKPSEICLIASNMVTRCNRVISSVKIYLVFYRLQNINVKSLVSIFYASSSITLFNLYDSFVPDCPKIYSSDFSTI